MLLTLDILKERLTTWKGCDLAKTANAVFGEGNPHAQVMFIGEAPGQKEDELKRPFVGASGKFLDDLLASIGLKREDVYISNVVKFRPPNNRDPEPIEKEQCMPWLMLEIALLKPRVIVTLGRHSLGHFFPSKTITQAHGKPFPLTTSTRSIHSTNSGQANSGQASSGQADTITIFPIYHPAAALHNGNLRSSLVADFQALGDYLKTLS